jgi:hypothetical protein
LERRGKERRGVKSSGEERRGGERSGAYKVFVEKTERQRTLGRPRRKWENNIKINLMDIDWNNLAEDGDKWRSPVNSVIEVLLP